LRPLQTDNYLGKREAEWKLSMPTGEYTWKVIVVKHGGDIEKTEDIICESEAKLILEY